MQIINTWLIIDTCDSIRVQIFHLSFLTISHIMKLGKVPSAHYIVKAILLFKTNLFSQEYFLGLEVIWSKYDDFVHIFNLTEWGNSWMQPSYDPKCSVTKGCEWWYWILRQNKFLNQAKVNYTKNFWIMELFELNWHNKTNTAWLIKGLLFYYL